MLKGTPVECEADRMGKDDRGIDGKLIGEMIASRPQSLARWGLGWVGGQIESGWYRPGG